MAAVAVADVQATQFGGQGVEQLLAVGDAVVAAQLVLGDVAADEPVAEREADVDGTPGLGGEFRVDAPDGADESLKGEADALGHGGSLGLAHARNPSLLAGLSRPQAGGPSFLGDCIPAPDGLGVRLSPITPGLSSVTAERSPPRPTRASRIELGNRAARRGNRRREWTDGESDLLAAMEAMKPLVAALVADKAKRIADLLG